MHGADEYDPHGLSWMEGLTATTPHASGIDTPR